MQTETFSAKFNNILSKQTVNPVIRPVNRLQKLLNSPRY